MKGNQPMNSSEFVAFGIAVIVFLYSINFVVFIFQTWVLR